MNSQLKNSKNLPALLFVFVITLLSLVYFLNSNNLQKSFSRYSNRSQTESEIDSKIILKIGQTKFNVETADTEEKQETGLSFRDNLEENSGMLFIFENESRRDFWMKDMNFDIDIIWIDGRKKVVGIEKNVSKDSYDKNKTENSQLFTSTGNTKYVLEINSGLSEKYNLKVGDSVVF